MKKLLIIGGGISQLPTILAAKKKEIEVIVVDGNKFAEGRQFADYFYNIDIKQEHEILKIAKKHKINGVIVPGTDFPFVGAFIAEELGLPSVSLDTAKRCTNKFEMRKALEQAGLKVPKFFKTKQVISKTVIPMEYPLVVKPVDSMAARGVRKIYSDEDLAIAIKQALLFSRSKETIVEEYKEGIELSIDSFVYNGEIYVFGVADRHFALEPYFIETGHTVPSALPDEIIDKAVNEFKKGVKALGIDFGAAKGDVKITNEGIMICEIAARISGGYLSGWTIPYALGKNPHSFLVDLSLGLKPNFKDLEQTKFLYSSERAILSIPGRIEKIYNLYLASHMAEFVKLYVNEGDEVFFPINNALRCGSVLSIGTTYKEAIYKASRCAQQIILRLDPENEETNNFLTESGFKMFIPSNKETDWHDENIFSVLHRIRRISKVDLSKFLENDLFWNAVYTGGLQGGLYFVDKFYKELA